MDVNNNHNTRLNLSKIGSILILFIGVVLGLSLLRNINTILSANAQVADAKQKLLQLEAKNFQLQQEAFEADSPAYKEKLMRDQLGLAKPGDNVLVLPNADILRKLSPIIHENTQSELPPPNWQKWLDLFF